MKCLIQRVNKASVEVNNKIIGKIKSGLLVFLGITHDDNEKDIDYLVKKITNLRIFEDEKAKMNLSLKDIDGEMLIVSQFTLYAETKKGRRPDFFMAAKPELAKKLYEKFIDEAKKEIKVVKTGQFGEHMIIELENDGPVTIIVESKK